MIKRLFGGAVRPERWTPTHQHRKGGLYRLRGYGVLEADRSAVAIYDDASGTTWVRAASEFDDGRFTPLDTVQDS